MNLPNFIGIQQLDYLNNAVLRFQRNHPILQEFMNYMKQNFNGNIWGKNGPTLVTNVMKKFCSKDKVEKIKPETCFNITVFEPSAFYLIPYWV